MKVDISKIAGFDTMTAEEKLKALLDTDFDVDHSGYIAKEQFDKVSSQLAEAKRNLKSRQSEEEQKASEREQQFKELQENYNNLVMKNSISEHKAKFIAMGYDEKLAENTADALVKGDTSTVFANQQAFLKSYADSIRSDAMKNYKPLASGAAKAEQEEANIGSKLASAENAEIEAAKKAQAYYFGGAKE